MNRDVLEGKWMQLRGAVREKWGDLTDDDLDKIAGKRDKLAGVLQERYGLTKREHIDSSAEPESNTEPEQVGFKW